jgi:lipopolysaccharide/colanic/teichoic acid biosynthesis glycosyltransferase
MRFAGGLYVGVKAVMDVVVAALMLVLFAPLLLVLALLIRLDSAGPAIYRQSRLGRSGRLFTMYKFRTMKVGTPVLSTEEMQQQAAIPFTRLGPILRKTNLDELVQLINVLKGEMSFIGPRPALPSQTDVIALRAKSGADRVRPGITGLAQVMGRDDLDVKTKVAYDTQYCRALGLPADLSILLKTFGAVVSARGNK